MSIPPLIELTSILFIWDINLGLAALNRDLGDLNG